jgi:hypothetical protein
VTRQARGVGRAEIAEFLNCAGEGIRVDRKRALLCMAYDTMSRRSELVALNVDDLTLAPDGSAAQFLSAGPRLGCASPSPRWEIALPCNCLPQRPAHSPLRSY